MERFRAGAFLGVVVAGGLIAFGATNCASPTQIILDVRASAQLCPSLSAAIAVSPVSEIDTANFVAYERGCDDGSDRVGLLTISPRDANDALVGIRIVGAINTRNVDRCGQPGPDGKPDWTDCVLARRRVQFAPGRTVTIIVPLTSDCVGQYCGGALECNAGVCVRPEQVQNDGGNAPPKDGDPPFFEDARVPDATFDGPTDAGTADACALCNGTSCNAGECRVDCNQVDCTNKGYCADGLNCIIDCPAADKCKNTRCATNGSCTFNCTGGVGDVRHCDEIFCAATTCKISCQGGEKTCSGVYVDGGTNSVTCPPTTDDKVTCDKVECAGGTCTRTCGNNGAGCGPSTNCSGNCAAWEDAGGGGGGG